MLISPNKSRLVVTTFLTALVLAACVGESQVASSDESLPVATDSVIPDETGLSDVDAVEESEEEILEDGLLEEVDLANVFEETPNGVIVERPCGGGFCDEGFVLNGRSYDRVCLVPALDGAVSDQQVGEGLLFDEEVSVRRVVGLDDDVLVVDLSCDDSDNWFFIVATNVPAAERDAVFCEVGQVDDDLRQRLCDDDG